MSSIYEDCSIKELLLFDTTKPMADFGVILAVAVCAVILNNIVFSLILSKTSMKDSLGDEENTEYEALKEKGISPALLGVSEVLNSGIYAPLVEELFFRFLLFKVLMVKTFNLNIHTANILHAVIFGSLHMTNAVMSDQGINKTILQSIASATGGLISGYTYVYTNSILTPLLSHFLNNMIATGHEMIDYMHFYSKIAERFSL
jgi:membrane protease YdiL (CAAX protease family)